MLFPGSILLITLCMVREGICVHMNVSTTQTAREKRLSTTETTTVEGLSTTETTTVEDGGTINIDEFTLEELCLMFNISAADCSCAIHPYFCRPPDDVPKTRTFNCSVETDLILGITKLTTACAGLIGNGVVLLVTWYSHREMKQFRKLVAYLALCDFIFSALQVMTSIPLLWTCRWVYGWAMCKLLSSSVTFGGMVPLGIIVIIAIERYYGIVKPFTKHVILSKLWPLLLLNVFVCFSSVIPIMVTVHVDETGLCTSDWNDTERGSEIYNWFLLVATFILPIFAISVLYVKIIRFLYVQITNVNGVLNMNEKARLYRLQVNKRVLKILVTVLVAYIILVFPNRLGWLILDLTDNLSDNEYHALKFFILIPYPFHVAINPLIYSAIDKRFRQDLLSMFRKKKPQEFVIGLSESVETNLSVMSGSMRRCSSSLYTP